MSHKAVLWRGQPYFLPFAAAALTYRTVRNVAHHRIMIITVNAFIIERFYLLLSDHVLAHQLRHNFNSFVPRYSDELRQIVVAVPTPTEGGGEGTADKKISTELNGSKLFIQNMPLHGKVSLL